MNSTHTPNGSLQTVLVFHEVFHHGGHGEAWHYAGALLGLRHYSSSGSSGSKSVGGSRGSGSSRAGTWR